MSVRLKRIGAIHAICAYALSDTPEEDAKKKIMAFAKSKSLIDKNSVSRLFGRNTYPTKNPEPHGYEYYLTSETNFEPEEDLEENEIPSGLYAVLRFKNLYKIGAAWTKLLKWIDDSPHEHVGWNKGKHGFVGGFEEHLKWKEEKPYTEWLFDLWVKLKE
jgi:DNA gyrase inhibitor GyrI